MDEERKEVWSAGTHALYEEACRLEKELGPWPGREEAWINFMASEVADEIDQEILEEIRALGNKDEQST